MCPKDPSVEHSKHDHSSCGKTAPEQSSTDHSHHHHHHGHAHGVPDYLGFAFFLNFVFSIIELIGGFLIGSVAITAGAIHDFGDSVSLGTAWILERYAKKQKDHNFNFGYRRFSLLSALVSGIVISSGSTIIVYKSIERMLAPASDRSPPLTIAMVLLASLGLAVNGLAAWRLSHGKTQNEKMLTWHLLEDLMSWAVVLVGALIIWATGVTWLDPLLAIGLSILILINVLKHLKSTVYIFLQGRPRNFNEKQFLAEALAVNGVEHVDHLAVWSLDGETSILSARLHLHSVHDPIEIEFIKAGVRTAAEKQNAQATLETCLAAHLPHGDDH